MRPRLYWAAFLMILAAVSVGSAAQVPQPVQFDTARLQNYSVQIDIEKQIAHVQIEQTYFNPTDRVLEETYLFPVQQGATISSLTLCNDETGCTEGELLGATEARQLYESIVRQSRDPALLEYRDDRSFQVRIFPINPNSTQTIKVSYQVVLNRSSELVELIYPITSQKAIEQMLIQVTIKSDEAIGNVYSPSHTISQERISENEVQVGYEANNLKSDNDFKLYYAVAQDGVAMNLLSFKPNDVEDGYFLMLVSWPQFDREPLPKDIVFVLDTSGSMSGPKIDQARASLRHALGRLNPEDRVGLVMFSDVIRAYSTELIQVSELDRADIESYISNIDAAGGTNIHSAMMRGLDLFRESASDGRPQLVVFLTDGLPTAGETRVQKILEDVLGQSENMNSRIFTFGVGYDVNTLLLDTLSHENGGFTTYVEPGENIEDSIASFYDRVGTPLIWDLQSRFTGVDVYDVYPVRMPDLFEGDMLEIVGRYRAGGMSEITLSGQGTGLNESFSEEAEFASGWTDHEYLKKIWAGRAIGYLLTQIRLNGESPELVERVRELGETYGIVTPYTSFFANPEEGDDGMGEFMRSLNNMSSDPTAPQNSSGQSAVQASEALDQLSNLSTADEVEAYVFNSQKILKNRTFENFDGRWIDSKSLQAEPDVQIQFGSDAYFALADRSDLTEILKLGANIVFTTTNDAGEEVTVEIGDLGIASADQLPSGLSQPVVQNSNQNQNNSNNAENVNTSNNNQSDNNPTSNSSENTGNEQNSSNGNNNQPDSQNETASAGQTGDMSTLLLLGIGLVVAILVGAGYWMLKK